MHQSKTETIIPIKQRPDFRLFEEFSLCVGLRRQFERFLGPGFAFLTNRGSSSSSVVEK